MFYFLTGLCCCFWGLFFTLHVYNFVTQSFKLSIQMTNGGLNIHQNLVANYIVFVHYMMILVIAPLSLRFFTEEKRFGTFSLLLSSPVSSLEIVLAKSLFGVSFVFVLLLVSAVYPLSLFFFVKVPLKLFLFSYFGVFLLLCVYMMTGLLASIITESLVICVVLTIIFILLLMFMGIGGEMTDIRVLKDIFDFLSLGPHFDFFKKGVLNLSSIFYFLSLFFSLGFIAERLVEFHRWR